MIVFVVIVVVDYGDGGGDGSSIISGVKSNEISIAPLCPDAVYEVCVSLTPGIRVPVIIK